METYGGNIFRVTRPLKPEAKAAMESVPVKPIRKLKAAAPAPIKPKRKLKAAAPAAPAPIKPIRKLKKVIDRTKPEYSLEPFIQQAIKLIKVFDKTKLMKRYPITSPVMFQQEILRKLGDDNVTDFNAAMLDFLFEKFTRVDEYEGQVWRLFDTTADDWRNIVVSIANAMTRYQDGKPGYLEIYTEDVSPPYSSDISYEDINTLLEDALIKPNPQLDVISSLDQEVEYEGGSDEEDEEDEYDRDDEPYKYKLYLQFFVRD